MTAEEPPHDVETSIVGKDQERCLPDNSYSCVENSPDNTVSESTESKQKDNVAVNCDDRKPERRYPLRNRKQRKIFDASLPTNGP